jgi:hypothetical protein
LVQIDFQHLAIQKQQGIEGLILGGCRDMSLRRQEGEKNADLTGPHFAGVAVVEVTHKVPNPIAVRFLGAPAVMKRADPVTDLIHEPDPWHNVSPV